MSDVAADDLDFGRSEPAPSPQPAESAESAAPPNSRTVPGERTISPVAGRFGLGKSGKSLAVLGLVGGCGVFLAAAWTHPKAHAPKAGTQEPARQVVDWSSVKGAAPPTQPPGPLKMSDPSPLSTGVSTLAAPRVGAPSLTGTDEPTVPALAVTTTGPTSSSTAPAAAAKAAAAQQAAAAQTARLQAIRGAPLLAYSAEVRGTSGDATRAPAAVRSEAVGGGELDQLRRGSTIGLVHAQRLPDRNFLLTAGALLPCVLETAIDTSSPGFVTCRITRDIYSDNGGVVLMEKGSRVLGEYRSGFQQGRARVFVLWDRITTPGGVAVDVSSPASDALGRAGVDGRIDSHFWQRFGGALLLTSVSGGISAAATADARFANIAQAPNEAAAVALQNSVNIPPTLTKPQGAEVGVFVSHDLDFSSVYALKAR